MILSDKTIRDLAANCDLLVPFDENKLQAVSYDISSGKITVVFE